MAKYVNNIADLCNDIIKETIGEESTLLTEDLSNVVDVGTTVLDSENKDHFVKALTRRIGKTVTMMKEYKGKDLGLLADSFEYGSILQKVRIAPPTFSEMEDWSLEDGTVYECNMFYGTTARQTFYESKNVVEIDVSIAESRVAEAFTSAEALTGFINGIFLAIANRINMINEQLALRAVDMALGETCKGVTMTGAGNNRCINVLKLYNDKYNKTLAAANCLEDPDFIRFFAYIMKIMKDKLSHMTKLYNLEGWENYTAEGELKTIIFSPVMAALEVFLQSDTFHKELVSLPGNIETVAAWQGIGNDFAAQDKAGSFKVKVSDGSTTVTGPDLVLGCMFSKDALTIMNKLERVDSNYVAKGNFSNYYYKYQVGLAFDKCENFICLVANDSQ